MKKLLLALFVALLMVGCGEEQGGDSPESNQSAAGKVDLDDPETLAKVIGEAIDERELMKDWKEGKALYGQKPYTGWAKGMYRNVRKVQNVQSYDTNSTLPDAASEDVAEPMLEKLTQFKAGKVCLEAWWYEKGQKSLVVNVKEGERDGLTIGWYENGQKGGESIFKDGKLISAVAWKPNGEKCSVTNVKDGNGVAVMYNEDGTEGGRAILKDGEMVSLMQTQWHENGQKESEYTLKDDKPDGLWTYWHENGQKSLEETYKDGSLEGASEWYESGQKKSESTFEGENELSEVATEWEWYSNGQKKSESIYKDGELNGPAVEWHENGQKAWEGAYKDGKADGLQTEWYENGQKSLEGTFKDGEEISFKSWDEDGNPE